jgi:hypothetical protein
MSETCAEIIFIKQVLEFLRITVKFPIIVSVDNTGAIYLANNQSTGKHTKHVDVRYHFVREFIEDGIVKIVFVKSAENKADVFTKNLGGELFKRHTGGYLKRITYSDEDCELSLDVRSKLDRCYETCKVKGMSQ